MWIVASYETVLQFYKFIQTKLWLLPGDTEAVTVSITTKTMTTAVVVVHCPPTLGNSK